ncbi:hypothetical protein [Marinicella sp. W31]|uniref:hypothetical protein n=1 Tax=Marinicella sp. W31 TaxID=3023713 RepID=UPI003757E730
MTGQRKGSEWINAMINNNDVYSYKLSGVNGASSLELDIDDVLDNFGVDKNEISRGVLAYGLWTRYNLNTTPYRKAMTVDKMNLSTCSNPYRAINVNGQSININSNEQMLIWGEVYRQ